jgi:hypothetical protein
MNKIECFGCRFSSLFAGTLVGAAVSLLAAGQAPGQTNTYSSSGGKGANQDSSSQTSASANKVKNQNTGSGSRTTDKRMPQDRTSGAKEKPSDGRAVQTGKSPGMSSDTKTGKEGRFSSDIYGTDSKNGVPSGSDVLDKGTKDNSLLSDGGTKGRKNGLGLDYGTSETDAKNSGIGAPLPSVKGAAPAGDLGIVGKRPGAAIISGGKGYLPGGAGLSGSKSGGGGGLFNGSKGSLGSGGGNGSKGSGSSTPSDK